MKKLFKVIFWSMVENLGNLSYWVYQIWFNLTAYQLNYDTQTYAFWQTLNHFMVLIIGMMLFIVRYYLKNKINLV